MIVLLTGGAANGKSRYAERLAAAYKGPRTYVATMRPDDDEGVERVRRHRKQREGLGFVTHERYVDLAGIDHTGGGFILLECIATLLDNEYFLRGQTADKAVNSILEGIANLASAADVLVIVTNRIEAKGNKYGDSTQAYIDTISSLNETLMECADAAIEMQVGLPICLKGRHLLKKYFPSAPVGTAVICNPTDVLQQADRLVLALADRDEDIHELAVGNGYSTLDDILQRFGDRAFAVPFERYALVFSRFRGDGVIPLDPAERRLRVQAGRLLIHIAAKAAHVLYKRDGVWLFVMPDTLD